MSWLHNLVIVLFVYLIQYAVSAFDECCVYEKPDTFKDISSLIALNSEKCVECIPLNRVVSFEFNSWLAEEVFPTPEEIDRMHLEWVNGFI